MCKHPALILEGMTPHGTHRHDDGFSAAHKTLARNAGNIAWLLRRHRFNIACGVRPGLADPLRTDGCRAGGWLCGAR